MNRLLSTALVLAVSGSAHAANPFGAPDYHGGILRDLYAPAPHATAVQPGIGDRYEPALRPQSSRDMRSVNPDLYGTVLRDVGHDGL
jgi:hypothetical protein